MRPGFSLVELSIVLVILGLLTGGILAGQSLIRAAELRSVSTDVSRYMAAVHSFRDKYFALPGDMTNAKSFWTSCTDVAGNTCNGNGDGIILSMEEHRAWQHLALAGLVEGNYNGLDNGTPRFLPGTNLPRSRINNGSYRLARTGGYGRTGNAFNFSNPTSNSNYWGYVVSVEDAWNIDNKMDDGKADGGNVFTFNGSDGTTHVTTCVTSVDAWTAPATYNLATKGIVCAMAFYL